MHYSVANNRTGQVIRTIIRSSGSPPALPAGSVTRRHWLRVRKVALRYLRRTLDADVAPSVVVGLDAGFTSTLPLEALRPYIRSHAGVDIGFDVGTETFSSMLIMQLLGSGHESKGSWSGQLIRKLAPLIRARSWNGRYRFFFDDNGFASDTDCTGVAASALYETGHLTRDELLQSGAQLLAAAAPFDVPADKNLDGESQKPNGALHRGVVMVYWEDGVEPGVKLRGRKHDAATCANALYALELAGREGLVDLHGVIAATRQYVFEHLQSGAYHEGTRYYPSPDVFLYFVSRLCARFGEYREIFGPSLRAALAERNATSPNPGSPDDSMMSLNLAMRVLCAENLGDMDASDQKAWLASQQELDGSWKACPFYSLGRLPVFFGSSTLTTLFALRAVG